MIFPPSTFMSDSKKVTSYSATACNVAHHRVELVPGGSGTFGPQQLVGPREPDESDRDRAVLGLAGPAQQVLTDRDRKAPGQVDGLPRRRLPRAGTVRHPAKILPALQLPAEEIAIEGGHRGPTDCDLPGPGYCLHLHDPADVRARR